MGDKMKLCRFLTSQRETRMGMLTAENQLLDLSEAGVNNLTFLLEAENPLEQLENLSRRQGFYLLRGLHHR